MKTIIFIFLFFLTASLSAQPGCQGNRLGAGNKRYAGLKHTDNTIFATFQAVDKGFGAGYSRILINNWGLYGAISYGQYYVPELSKKYENINHFKFAFGSQYGGEVASGIYAFFLLGISHHQFWGSDSGWWVRQVFDKYNRYSKLNHWSGENGAGMTIKHRWTVMFRYDWIRAESNVDLGISF